MQVVVEIPDEFSQRILPAGQDPSRALLEEAVLKAFCEDRVTAYELRLILGFETRYQLDSFLKQRGIDHGAYGPEDLEQDTHTMDRLRERSLRTPPHDRCFGHRPRPRSRIRRVRQQSPRRSPRHRTRQTNVGAGLLFIASCGGQVLTSFSL